MFLELNYYEPSKQDKFPNWLLSQHLHIAVFFPREMGVIGLLGVKCPVEVKFMRSGLMETEPHREKKSGRVDIRGKTNSLTSKPWQTLLTGPLVSQLSSQMPFKPFILLFTGNPFIFSLHCFWCVFH